MIIFLYGGDSFRSLEKLAEIKNKFLNDNGPGANLSDIDFERDNAEKLAEMISSNGLFSPKQLVVSRNLIASGSEAVQEEILDFLRNKKVIAEDKNTVVVFWEGLMPKKSNKLFKFLEKNSKHQDFETLQGAKLENWIRERIGKINPKAEISKGALSRLIAYAGSDLFQISGEISKLVNYKEEGIIEEKDVEILVKAKISANIFETVEAISGGNKKIALKLLHNQIKEGGDLFYILSMYIYQFRNLLKIGEFFSQGRSDQYGIAKEAGLHPYVVKKALGQLRNMDITAVKSIYKKLQKLDTGVKTGKMDIKMALDKFVVEC